MAKVKRKPRAFLQRVKLTPEEFASLKEVGRSTQGTIPDAHRDRLIAAGYVREVVRGFNVLALTGRGIARLDAGK